MGWMRESTPEKDGYLVAPVSEPTFDNPLPRAGDDPPLADELGLQFSQSANVTGRTEVDWVFANVNLSNPQVAAYPTHRSVTFLGYRGAEENPSWLYLRVHPAAEWEDITQIPLDDLRTQLDDRPANPYLTGLPLMGAARLLNVEPTYVVFQNGSGIRALVQYIQSGAPVVDGELIYQFVGMTDDRKYLVHAAFPLTSTLLPTDADRDTQFNFDTYTEYLTVSDNAFPQVIADVLATVPDTAFTPRLGDLDTFMASLRVDEPPAWCGEVPSRLSPNDTVQQAIDVTLRVRDSANGKTTNSFYPGEEAAIIDGPVCVAGVVWWKVFRVNAWSGWVAELEGDAYYLEKVNE